MDSAGSRVKKVFGFPVKENRVLFLCIENIHKDAEESTPVLFKRRRYGL
jgi:hypothetical protein